MKLETAQLNNLASSDYDNEDSSVKGRSNGYS